MLLKKHLGAGHTTKFLFLKYFACKIFLVVPNFGGSHDKEKTCKIFQKHAAERHFRGSHETVFEILHVAINDFRRNQAKNFFLKHVFFSSASKKLFLWHH
jgi:hypothetical protein